MLGRHTAHSTDWTPGEPHKDGLSPKDRRTARPARLGDSLTDDPALAPYAGLAAVELGKQLAPVRRGSTGCSAGSPLAGDLIRTAQPARSSPKQKTTTIVRCPDPSR